MHNFKKKPFENRIIEAINMIDKYPDRLPIICDKYKRDTNIPNIDKNKYLIPIDFTVAQFIYVIRNRMRLPPEKALFIIVKDIIPSNSTLIKDLYNEYHDVDRFLYINYTSENTFG
jgi:GABA(A) receptor-associated protein